MAKFIQAKGKYELQHHSLCISPKITLVNYQSQVCLVSTLIKFDFERGDSINLILAKSELNIKWLVFRYIHVKVSRSINLKLNISSVSKS